MFAVSQRNRLSHCLAGAGLTRQGKTDGSGITKKCPFCLQIQPLRRVLKESGSNPNETFQVRLLKINVPPY